MLQYSLLPLYVKLYYSSRLIYVCNARKASINIPETVINVIGSFYLPHLFLRCLISLVSKHSSKTFHYQNGPLAYEHSCDLYRDLLPFSEYFQKIHWFLSESFISYQQMHISIVTTQQPYDKDTTQHKQNTQMTIIRQLKTHEPENARPYCQ
jgi:hypothetical protein